MSQIDELERMLNRDEPVRLLPDGRVAIGFEARALNAEHRIVDLESEVAKREARYRALRASLDGHIMGCATLCNDKKDCGYAPYKNRQCPHCPMHEADELQAILDDADAPAAETRLPVPTPESLVKP